MQLSCGEFAARRRRETPKLNFGLSVAVGIQEFQLDVKTICGHLCLERFSAHAALDGNLFRVMLLLWAASHRTDAPSKYLISPSTPPLIHVSHSFFINSVALPACSHILPPLSLCHPLLFSLSLSPSLLWENLLLSMNSTVTTPQPVLTPIITSTVKLAPVGFEATRCSRPCSSATINYDEKPN